LVYLSRGGSDARVVREFDMTQLAFINAGFTLPEAKSVTAWVDADWLFVGTDVGPGSLTSSGYPRTVLLWRRGTPLSEAEPVFEGEPGDVSGGAWADPHPGSARDVVQRWTDFF